MLPEIALTILDIAQNSVRAEAKLTEISVNVDTEKDTLCVNIKDNGCGMTPEQIEKVTDPFFTTRTTRDIGLGVPFFKQGAEMTGGSFEIVSEENVGTKTSAVYGLSHIDRMPLGDMVFTVHTLVTLNNDKNFVFSYTVDDNEFVLDTREFREIMGDVPLNEPEVSSYIKEFLSENINEVNNGKVF